MLRLEARLTESDPAKLRLHRPFQVDEWLLLSHTSPTAAGGAALDIWNVHTRDGELVPSFAQEPMLRLPEEGPDDH